MRYPENGGKRIFSSGAETMRRPDALIAIMRNRRVLVLQNACFTLVEGRHELVCVYKHRLHCCPFMARFMQHKNVSCISYKIIYIPILSAICLTRSYPWGCIILPEKNADMSHLRYCICFGKDSVRLNIPSSPLRHARLTLAKKLHGKMAVPPSAAGNATRRIPREQRPAKGGKRKSHRLCSIIIP